MSGVSDGATTRRERIMDMLQYVRGFMPNGLPINQIQLYMSMAHGLTYKKSQEYIYEMQQGGVLHFNAGLVKVNQTNFRRLMEIMAPDRDPDTGVRKMLPFDEDSYLVDGRKDAERRSKRSSRKKKKNEPEEDEEDYEDEEDDS